MNDLKNKKVVIIGGAGLIGSSIVEGFKYSGSKVFVIDRNLKKNSKSVKYYKIDFFEKNWELNFCKILSLIKSPSILVNCSYPRTDDWAQNSYKQVKFTSLEKNIKIHLNSFVWISKIFAENAIKKKIKDCSIVNIASIYGSLGQDPKLYKNIKSMSESITYPVVKGGIINSCRSMAAYYGQYHIRVNVISPGGVYAKQNKKFIKRYIEKTPLGRMAKPKDISNVVLFLSSNISSYITGVNLNVDGGFSII